MSEKIQDVKQGREFFAHDFLTRDLRHKCVNRLGVRISRLQQVNKDRIFQVQAEFQRRR